jgi:protoporphyrinogen oxidase
VREIARGLVYRDFIMVGLLLRKLVIRGVARPGLPDGLVPDNWIYVQEPDVRIGRLQIFNNWSPALVRDPDTIWLGLEYFCREGDELWARSDAEFVRFAIDELASIEVIDPADVLDSTILRVPKTYPAYFGTYDRFDELRAYLDRFDNLFLVGRNGMHRYNNQDHSMLTAMTAVDNILAGVTAKDNLWAVNTEPDYHEEKDDGGPRPLRES